MTWAPTRLASRYRRAKWAGGCGETKLVLSSDVVLSRVPPTICLTWPACRSMQGRKRVIFFFLFRVSSRFVFEIDPSTEYNHSLCELGFDRVDILLRVYVPVRENDWEIVGLEKSLVYGLFFLLVTYNKAK